MSVSRLTICAALATTATLGATVAPAVAGNDSTGNGAPSGSHYTLNIIGVSKDKASAMDGNNGSRIFVPLWGNAKINLTEGDFGVLDANGTDKDGATFSLPNPDPDADGVTEYSVYARALGTPGGSSTTTTCATDPVTDEEICSTESMVLVRNTGKSYFDNVSRELLYVYYDLDEDGTAELIPLFDSRLQDYFWDYDNKGLKVAQLRFYEQATDVNN
ncbi:MAG TPA: hypothetical protein VLA97_13195 [Nocardioidaceae bacterium]|nr:hypothetical protein [Nocardioidaceae bacterium]